MWLSTRYGFHSVASGNRSRLGFLVRKVAGKRLTYAELTGKTLEAGPSPEETF
jgi:hypothetical protein